MGTDMKHYVVLGAKFTYDEFYPEDTDECHEKWVEYEEGKDGIRIIADGMSGEWVIIGKVLAESSGSRWETGDFPECIVIATAEEKSFELFDKIWHIIPHELRKSFDKLRFLVFTHYS